MRTTTTIILVVIILIAIAVLALPYIRGTNTSSIAQLVQSCVTGGGEFNVTIQTCVKKTEEASTTNTNASSTEIIRITTPRPNDIVSSTSPLVIQGQARGTWFFEGSFPVIITDANGLTLVTTVATSTSDWMTTNFIPFQAIARFPPQISGSKGFVVLKNDNPSGLPQNEVSVKIPIKFK